ncbi:SCP2 sterol-binding domain-containing protein [Terrabacter sp. BE26]|uniref:SCP2 sterol-binding domain-containing protein n=1 Tax=Terrabacter sp. BE26 TaxID=2898152 RepID=UPI0035BE3C45
MSHIDEFFDELSHRGHQPLLERVVATIRFEVHDDMVDMVDASDSSGANAGDRDRARSLSRWVTIDHGDLSVSADGDTAADVTITCTASELDDLVSGRTSAMASLLRGALTVQGDPELVVLAQRLFSRSPGATRVPSPVVDARAREGGAS